MRGSSVHRLILVAALAGLSACADEQPVAILAHYMPWFRAEPLSDGQVLWEHWQWFGKGPKHDPDDFREDGRRDIASVFYPLIGPYDGRDPAVLEYHFLTARAAGIEGFVADWYGPGTYSDEVFGHMIRAAERYGMKVAICLEEKAFFPGYASVQSRAEMLDVAERHIRHVLSAHAPSSAYLREDGRPVFYMFVNFQDGALGRHILSPDELADLLGRFDADGGIFFVRTHFDEPYAGVADGMFGWVGDAAYRSNFYERTSAWLASGELLYAAGAAVPGFDDTGVWGWGTSPRRIDRRGTREYDDHWESALAHRPHAVQIATWNDFQEGSTIEPAEEYGFTFIDRTEEWVERLNGRPVNLRDNLWPHRVYLLRRGIEALDPDSRAEMGLKVDQWVDDLLDGRRFWMAGRLKRLANMVRKQIPVVEGE